MHNGEYTSRKVKSIAQDIPTETIIIPFFSYDQSPPVCKIFPRKNKSYATANSLAASTTAFCSPIKSFHVPRLSCTLTR